MEGKFMEQGSFVVEPRLTGTDSILHHLRDDGFIPGIMYGGKEGNQPIRIEQRAFLKQMRQHGKSGIFSIEMGEELVPVKINEIQRNPVDRNVIHVDLQRVDMSQPVEMFIPIHFFGQSVGEANGGVLQQQLREIEVRSLPSSIPETIQLNIADLDIGDALVVRDVVLPKEVEILQDLDSVIVKVLPPKMDLEEHTEEPKSEPEIVNARDSHGIDAAK